MTKQATRKYGGFWFDLISLKEKKLVNEMGGPARQVGANKI